MTGPEYDAELEAFLKRRSPMHRRLSDIDHAEPSVEIDRLVLNRAREAIDTREQPLYRTSRWALPAGLAAAILIAFTVVLNIDHREANVASNASPAAEAAAQAPAPAVARATKAGAEDIASLAADRSRLTASTGSAVAPQIAPAAPPAPAATADAANPHSSPDAWLREISRLRTNGRAADADRELAAFRAAYPTHPAYSVAKPPAR
jgi:hypothetical protein